MRVAWFIFIGVAITFFAGCSDNSQPKIIDPGLQDTGQAFNPLKWYGKNRIDFSRLLPEISNINKSVSGGPFILKEKMGVKEIHFTFENSARDAKLLNLQVLFNEPVTLTQAQKKFGVELTGVIPQKTQRYWHFPIQKPMIHGFMVDLKPMDSDSTRFLRAWIAYRLN